MSEWINKLTAAYAQQNEAMDPVDKAELKGKHKDRKDKDIDNDGDVDSSDEYLHKRRKAISKDESKKEAYNEPQGQAKRMMSPLHKMRMDKEKKDRDSQGKLKPGAVKKEAYEGIPKSSHKPGPASPPGEGLSPSAKDQLAKKMPTPEPVDEPKVDAKNFKDFRKTMKTAATRPGDNKKGDKNIVK